MKRIFYFPVLLGCLIFLASGCQKDQPTPTVTIDIKVPDPVITTLSNGSKKLDFSIEVTQTGDFFYQDFDFKLTNPVTSGELDHYQALLSAAHQFVYRSVVVQPGTYQVNVFIGPADNGGGSSSTIVVP